MFIITVDFAGALPKETVPEFLTGLRGKSFGAIPDEVRERNGLIPDNDCIAIHLGTGIIGWFLRRLVRSGAFPDFLALMFFSAKDGYIPHDANIIAGIAQAAGEFIETCGKLRKGIKAAAWAMPLVLGKWVPVQTR